MHNADQFIDRRAFIAKLGGAAAVATMAPEVLAEAIEHEMMDELDQAAQKPTADVFGRFPPIEEVRGGMGLVFDKRRPLPPMPDKPTLVDFFTHRFAPARHVLQSATHALKTGQPERTVMACLLHDIVLNLARPDHGWWGAQLLAPYVEERITWAIKYHQALRFYPDDEVGYEYPESYNKIFGKDYVPDQYVKEAYEYARDHKWYMESRLITMNDMYAFNPDVSVSLDPFIDIIGRHFKQPKEGLGFDNSSSAHMWRSLIFPDRRL
jgi:hypothetical protein